MIISIELLIWFLTSIKIAVYLICAGVFSQSQIPESATNLIRGLNKDSYIDINWISLVLINKDKKWNQKKKQKQ